MRLFIAVMLPDDAAKELYGFADALKKKGVTGRIVREQDLHITLAFIGEYGDSNDVIDALSDIDLRPMTIHINDWILDKRSILKAVPLKNEALEELASDIRKALNTARIYYDRKPFSPHVTLMRRTGGIDDLKKTEETLDITFTTDRFSLMLSEIDKFGATYTEICSFVAD